MKTHVLLGSIGAAIVIAGYLVQIAQLARHRRAEGVSVASYLLWGTASALLLVHALRIGSPVFIVLTGFQVVGCLVIAAMAVSFVRSDSALHAEPARIPGSDGLDVVP